ncbi:hypothetical protein GCM10022409_04080 [Hymenobacter glaciei]|uniref:Uncharacterized protein n=1 Tax=Hymenobacter glaciei TaxID=877209 RepID=A0ABP7TAZ3_9BACT
MITHPYWGNVEEDWAGMSAEQQVVLPGVEQLISVFLGEELFEEDEEYDVSAAQLDDYAATFLAFVAEAPRLMADFREQAFARYQKLYARRYEDAAVSGATPLNLTSADQHASYLQKWSMLRVTEQQTIRLTLHYDLDIEHGLEAKFVNNVLVELGASAET